MFHCVSCAGWWLNAIKVDRIWNCAYCIQSKASEDVMCITSQLPPNTEEDVVSSIHATVGKKIYPHHLFRIILWDCNG